MHRRSVDFPDPDGPVINVTVAGVSVSVNGAKSRRSPVRSGTPNIAATATVRPLAFTAFAGQDASNSNTTSFTFPSFLVSRSCFPIP
jgi:hypothetical protein